MERAADEQQPNNATVTPALMAVTQLTPDDIKAIAKRSKLTEEQVTHVASMTPLDKAKVPGGITAVTLMQEEMKQNPSAPPAQGWGTWGTGIVSVLGQIRYLLTRPANETPINTVSVATPPMMMNDADVASSSKNLRNNGLNAPANNEHSTIFASMIDLGLEVPAEKADGLADSVLPNTLRDLEIIEEVVVSPPLLPEVAPAGGMPEEITLSDAEEHDEEPLLEEGEVEEQIAADEATATREREEAARVEALATAERVRLAEIQRQLEETARIERARVEALATAEHARLAEIQRQLEETARIERARVEALAAAERQQTLLLQQQRELAETRIREEAARKQQAALDAANEYQRSLAAARAAGF